MALRISAVICTYNRANVLPAAIESLVQQNLAPSDYEILVVDNASTDATASIVQEGFRHVPHLRYLYEPRLGLSQARNTGWQAAQGQYVAYIDDDAIADRFWLCTIIQTFETLHPCPGCITGKILPIWEIPRPGWLTDRYLLRLSVQDWSSTPRFLKSDEWIVGANMAFPRAILLASGGFSTSLGRIGKRLLCQEETELRERLEQAGHAAYYHPEILVHHRIPAHRLCPEWFYQAYFWAGVSNAIADLKRERPSWITRLGRGFYLLLRHILSPYYNYAMWIRKQDQQYFAARLSYWSMLGYALFLLKLLR